MAIVGIDLGTTNSLIGSIRSGRPALAKISGESRLLPSMVCFEPGRAEPWVGEDAKARRFDYPEATIYSAKRFMGLGAADVASFASHFPFDISRSDDHLVRFLVNENTYTPSEIGASVLRKLKQLFEEQFGEKAEKAVITVPAYFNDAQRQATKLAGELAGMEVVRIVNEPTAACLAYGLDKKSLGTVAVFDLGGGTFDISIVRVKDGVFEVLATNGNTALGGDDFDHRIADNLHEELDAAWGEQWRRSSQAKALLGAATEQAKRQLSDSDSTILRLAWQGKSFERRLSRQELERWIAPVVDRVKDPCLECLKDAGLRAEQLTDVILVGGSTRVPMVRRIVTELFGREPLCTLNPDEVVAMGAAVQANILAGQMGEILLLDVIPLSLGIENMGDVAAKIIHRNSTIPVSASQTFTTYVDGQVSVDIHVIQGERELASQNRSLARFKLQGLPPLPAGIPKIEVELVVDANGILSVRALELRTGTKASVTVNPTYGLRDEEVEKMLSDAYDNAESDFHARFLAEARTEADSLLRAARKALPSGRRFLKTGEETEIEKALALLEKSLSGEDHREIRRRIEALNEVTKGMAEHILNDTVRQALQNRSLKESE